MNLMSPSALSLAAWPLLAILVATFLLARRLASRSLQTAAPRWRGVVRELSGPLACALLVIPFALLAHSIFGVATPIDGVVLTNVTPWLPAGQAGLAVGDRLVSMDGEPLRSLEQIRARIIASNGQPLTFDIERGGTHQSLTVQPVQQAEHWMIGIAAPQQYRVDHQPGAVISESFEIPFRTLSAAVTSLRGVSADSRPVTLAGPLGVVPASEEGTLQRISTLLYLTSWLGLETGLFAELMIGIAALARWIRARKRV